MITQIGNSVFARILWGLMGLYLFNISVDSADFNPNYIPEDLSFNDQESIIEIVIEKILGFEDAIKEADDCDADDHCSKKSGKIDIFPIKNHSSKIAKSSLQRDRQKFPCHNSYLTSGFQQLDSPPPKI